MHRKRLVHAVPAFALAGCLIASLAAADPLPNAWQVYDNTTSSLLAYTNILSTGVRSAATNSGFHFSVTSRFVTDYGGSRTMIMIYGDSTARWEILWTLTNGDLVSQLITNLVPVQSIDFVVTTNGGAAAAYHTHEIIYDPTTRLASYVLDGQVLITNWVGAPLGSYNSGQVEWGAGASSGQGAMNFNKVSFTVTNGIVAGYDAGMEPSIPPDPVALGWKLSPSSPPVDTGTNAIAPDRGPNVVVALADSGYGSLRQTIADARSGDTITFFTNGTITLTSGELLIRTNLTIMGPGPANLSVSGSNARRVFRITNGVTAGISGLTIQNGKAASNQYGGGIYNSGTLTLSNCIISNSRAGDGTDGGNGTDGTLQLVNGGDGGNGTPGGDGGGIFSAGTLALIGCTLTNNVAGEGGKGGDGGAAFAVSSGAGGDGGDGGDGGKGGGIYSSGNLTMTDCILTANSIGIRGSQGSGGAPPLVGGTRGAGGAVGDYGSGGGFYTAGNASLCSNCIVSFNYSVSYHASGTLIINNSLITDNQFSGMENHASMTMNNSAVLGNTGSGIINYGTLAINNSTFHDNIAVNLTSGNGGAIYNQGTVAINNSTIAMNSAFNGGGGGIHTISGHIANLTNTIVAGNSAPNIFGPSLTANCLTGGNPVLAPLGNYGGLTPTMPPLTGSPALDAGLDAPANFLVVDQRGRSRLSGAHVDIGAVEAQQAVVVNTNDSGPGSLRGVITDFADFVTFAPALAGQTIYLTSGQLTLSNSSLSISASNLAGGVAVDAGGNSRVMEITNAIVTLDSLTITNGHAVGNGGGILVDDGAVLTMNNSTLAGNSASSGGGLYNLSGTVAMMNCLFTGNAAVANGGGMNSQAGTNTVRSSIFTGNFASFGGGVRNASGSSFTVNDSAFSGNFATNNGGGIANNASTFVLTNSAVSSNSASVGGGIYNVSDAIFVVDDSAFSGNHAAANGGGIVNSGSTFVLANSTFSSNSASFGGGIYNVSDAMLAVNGSTFTGNSATNNGGGIDNNGGTFMLTNSAVSSNFAKSGGGIYNVSGAVLVVNDSVLAGNAAVSNGGGINSSQNSTATIINATLTGNSASFGAGAVNTLNSLMEIDYSAVSNNSATVAGGGVHNEGGALVLNTDSFSGNSALVGGGINNASHSTLSVDSCYIAGNFGSYGGGIGNQAASIEFYQSSLSGNYATNSGGGLHSSTGTNIIGNSTISGNTALNGGGIYHDSGSSVVYNSTLSGNAATTNGGGIDNLDGGTLTLNHVTLAGNSVAVLNGGGGIFQDPSAGLFVLTNSIVAGNIASGITNNISGSFDLFSTVNCLTSGDPRLAPLGNYGGATQTRPLLAGSPAIDAGVDALVNFLVTDQRGQARKIGVHADIGAVEVHPAPMNNPPRLVNLVAPVGGGFSFGFTNVPDADFTVLATTNLALPFSQWSVLAPSIQISPGQYQFTDSSAGNYSRRFYRVTSP